MHAPILISMNVDPDKLEEDLKVLRMLGLLNDEEGLHTIIRMTEYMIEAARVKHSENVAESYLRHNRTSELYKQQYNEQLAAPPVQSPWYTTTTTSVADNRKIKPFSLSEVIGKFNPPV